MTKMIPMLKSQRPIILTRGTHQTEKSAFILAKRAYAQMKREQINVRLITWPLGEYGSIFSAMRRVEYSDSFHKIEAIRYWIEKKSGQKELEAYVEELKKNGAIAIDFHNYPLTEAPTFLRMFPRRAKKQERDCFVRPLLSRNDRQYGSGRINLSAEKKMELVKNITFGVGTAYDINMYGGSICQLEIPACFIPLPAETERLGDLFWMKAYASEYKKRNKQWDWEYYRHGIHNEFWAEVSIEKTGKMGLLGKTIVDRIVKGIVDFANQ